MGDAGAAVEAQTAWRRRQSQVGPTAFGAGTVKSRSSGTEEGFSRRGTTRQALGRSGTETEFCTGRRTAIVADDNEAQAPVNAESSAVSEPPGMSVGRGAHQAIQLGFRPTGQKRAADVASRGRRCDQSRGYSGTGGSSITR